MQKLVILIFVLGLAVTTGAWAASGAGDAAPAAAAAADKTAAQPASSLPDAPTPGAPAATAATPATSAVESALAEMRALLHAQAAEIEAQRRELAELKAKMGDVKEEAVDAAVSAAVPAATAAVSTAVPTNVVTAGGGQGESPLALHFKGITLTPGGFTAAETVYRNRELSADVNTPFTSIPFSGSNASKISEFNFSGRQSRISMKMDGKLADVTIGGYYEGDFLGAGTTSNNNQTNSYLFRQRQFWGDAAFTNGWFISGGQMWSLLTEMKTGLQNRTPSGGENANIPMTIDAQYHAGFSWARQYGFRIVDSVFDNKLSLGFSVEGSQTRFSASNANNNFVLMAPGSQAGLFNTTNGTATQNYTLNATPDFVFKAALDPGWGHYEIFGLLRTFRDRIYPCEVAALAPTACLGPPALPASSLASNNTRAGGGAGLNIRVPLFAKHVDVGFHALYGDGVGRYGSVGLNDASVRPNGTLAPIRGGQGLGTIEWHVTPKFDLYMYGGGDYVARTIFAFAGSPTGFIGYGAPTLNDSGCNAVPEAGPTAGGLVTSAANCAGTIRFVAEGTIGFWHVLYKGDRGRMQYGLQYSYVQLNAWSGTTGTPSATSAQFHPTTNDSMFFTSLRYYLP